MADGYLETDLRITGAFSAGSMVLPAGSVKNTTVVGNAGISAEKVEHRNKPYLTQTGTAVAATSVVYLATATCVINAVKALSIGICTTPATITIDCLKNGTTVLSSTIVLDDGNTARLAEAGTLSVTSMTAGDVLEFVVTVNAGGGTLGTGLYCWAEIDELAS